MNQINYKYSLYNYHAVGSASLDLEGITVLAGINGCGKSTLSRWLYYLVNESGQFSAHIIGDFIQSLSNRVKRMEFSLWEMTRSYDQVSSLTRKTSSSLDALDVNDPASLEKAAKIYSNFLDAYTNNAFRFETEAAEGARKNRAFRIFGGEKDQSYGERIEGFLHREQNNLFSQKQSTEQLIENRPTDAFFRNIMDESLEKSYPERIQLKEDGVKLLDGSVNHLFGLDRAIYVDSPMAVSENLSDDNIFWRNLRALMMKPREGFQPSMEDKKILLRIARILHGKVTMVKDAITEEQEFFFQPVKGKAFLLDEAATGYKTFSYMQRLVENGYLNEQSILLIDEPEAHLHPQWIVEFARLLVLVYKNLHTRIMIASHNPDMVAAIRAIAEKEQVLDQTCFYLAEEGQDGKYYFVSKGTDITDIFASFNIALDRIREYGVD